MTPAQRLLAALVLSTACAAPALAASSAMTSALDSLSTSVDSLSRSIKKSSDSSARTVVGQGDYRVVRVAQAEDGAQDVTLMAVPGSGAGLVGHDHRRLDHQPGAAALGGRQPGRGRHHGGQALPGRRAQQADAGHADVQPGAHRGRSRAHRAAPNSRQALLPPKPKELLATRSSGACRGASR